MPRGTASDKVVREKTFDIAKNPKYEGFQRGLSSVVYNFFDKKSSATHKRTKIKFDLVSENQKLVEELNKPLIRKLEKRKDNIWGADLADTQLISK